MEALAILLGLAVMIGIPAAAFAGLWRSGVARREIGELRGDLVGVQRQLQAIEARLAGDPAPAPEIVQQWVRPPGPVAETLLAPADAAAPVDIPAAAPPAAAIEPVTAPAPDPATAGLPTDSPVMRLARRQDAWRMDAAPVDTPPPEKAAETISPAAGLPPPARRDLEESLGTRWAVWLGGVTLAFGGLFLVKYSIDQGVFGPRVRIASGLAFALALLGAGEWLRRGEKRFEIGGVPSAHIPGILTAAGVVTAFGVVWAAYALYGMLGQTAAFVALGVVGLGALVASALHGPALAALGLVGSYGTPFLVGGDSADKTGLVAFLAVVSAVAFAVAWRKEKRWIAGAAVAGHGAWGALLVLVALVFSPDMDRRVTVEAAHLLVGLGLAALFLVWLPGRRDADASPFDPLTLAGLAIPSGLLVALAFLTGDQATLLWAGLAAIAILMLTACRHAGGSGGAVIAAVTAVGVIGAWPAVGARGLLNLVDPLALLRLDFPLVTDRRMTLFAALAAGLIAIPGFAVLARRIWTGDGATAARGLLAFAAALAPAAILAAATIRAIGLYQHHGAAALAAGLALALAAGGELLFRGERERRAHPPAPFDLVGAGAFLAGAAVALGLAISLALPRLWLAVGLAVASAGVAFVLTRRPAPALAAMSAMLATAAVGRVIVSPLVVDVGTWPILNWLLAAYGLPALAFAAGAFVLRGREPVRLRHLHEGLAVAFAAITVATEIRQSFVGPDLLATPFLGFGEVSFAAGAAALLAVAVVETARRQASPVFDRAALVFLVVAAFAALGLATEHNPLFSGRAVDGAPPFNRIGWGYGIPLVATAFAAWRLARHGDRRVAAFAQALAAAFAITFLALQLRRGFQGADLHWSLGITLAEGGLYAAAAFAGAASLAWLRERMASPVWEPALLAASAAGAALLLAGPGYFANPLLDAPPLAGPFGLDNALAGVALPAALAAVAAWLVGGRPRAAALACGLSAIAGALFWLVIEVRRAFQGVDVRIDAAPTGDGEWYAYSVLLVAFGVALLAVGFVLRNRELRLASAVVILAAAVKVFLSDMAGLEGIWRALSFIGLGGVLMAIGLVYQRLLAGRARPAAAGDAPV